MIDPSELRMGNYVLFKSGVRILPVKCGFEHFKLGEEMSKLLFPITFKPENLTKCGFIENKKYYQYPEVREFVLVLPVLGANKNEIYAYISNNKESYARATINDIIISNHVYTVHQLQNLFYALVGKEMDVTL